MERVGAGSPWWERINFLAHGAYKSDPVSLDSGSRSGFVDALRGYTWPGNVRELANVIKGGRV
jgi:DNA-binding NtrC family response regulator